MKKIMMIWAFCCLFLTGFADGGMWLPLFLKYNETEMQQLGFRLTAEDVYSVNNNSMKDAVVLFGGGCTGEMISSNGLVLTNHHCGYYYIQHYSTLENNYLHNGFWAKSYEEEIPCEGLTVTFLKYMQDVTDLVLDGTAEIKDPSARELRIKTNIAKIVSALVDSTGYSVYIKPFFYGNQYFMFVNQVFTDVRLVGTPPESIGKFGGDTDNWIWPRHTGDFSLYRVYTDKQGNPAAYSKENIPMTPKKHFKIAINGLNENDFTMVIGYPGTTMQYLISDGVDLVVTARNPAAIAQRGTRLDIMKKYMNQSTEIRLMYSAKANSISNGWKKWIGENKGILETNVIRKKQKEEEFFNIKIDMNPLYKQKYGNVIQNIKSDYAIYKPLEKKSVFLRETFLVTELPNFVEKCNYIVHTYSLSEKPLMVDSIKIKLTAAANSFYNSYYEPIDKEVFVELLYYYFHTLEKDLMPVALQPFANISRSNLQKMAESFYDNSIFSDKESFLSYVNKLNDKKINSFDKLISAQNIFHQARLEYVTLVYDSIPKVKERLNESYRIYLQALQEVAPERVKFPDANLTMRVTYGQMKGVSPIDGMSYLPYTTTNGILQKENPNIFDYKVDSKLKDLILHKSYGRYADENGDMRVAFIGSNQTTGGNSGSPVINGDGYLVGVNFDRIWEGTMSDIQFDLSRCRNISLDIRYFLFIVDKLANAQNIISELDIYEYPIKK